MRTPAGYVAQHAVAFGPAGGAATGVDADHPLPVVPRPRAVTYADRSGSVAGAGVAQPLAAANPARQGYFVQNLSAGDLWISSLGAATAGPPSLRVAPGQIYESPIGGAPAQAISILGATAGQAFSAREW